MSVTTSQESTPKLPRDADGKFMSRLCANLDCCGELQYQENRRWACDGLVDPGFDDQALQACTITHQDGIAHDH